MKLSDAIRKGCEMVPCQAFGHMFEAPPGQAYLSAHEVPFAACALGAALIGAQGNWSVGIPEAWFELLDTGAYELNLEDWQCPDEDCHDAKAHTQTLETWITTHNDDQRWTREHIADELERVGL